LNFNSHFFCSLASQLNSFFLGLLNNSLNVVPLKERRDLKIDDKMTILAVIEEAKLPFDAIFKYREFAQRYQIAFSHRSGSFWLDAQLKLL
jgi:hypothetical protein